MKRIAITGAAGLTGQHLIKELKARASLLCLDRNASPFETSPDMIYCQLDLLQPALWQKEIGRFRPDIIINCAAYSDVDACETNHEIAVGMNIELVENLLKFTSARILHYSSDYVFDGDNGPYSEADRADPKNYYGRTKLESEELLKKSGRDYLIIRTNVLYGLAKNIRTNFITWLVDSLKKHESVAIVADQFNNPTYAANLAAASIEALEVGLSGVLHFGGADYLSRYDAALLTAKTLNLDPGLIKKSTSRQLKQRAKRPERGGLNIGKARKLLRTTSIGLADGLKMMYDLPGVA